jgi:hypothetical protein
MRWRQRFALYMLGCASVLVATMVFARPAAAEGISVSPVELRLDDSAPIISATQVATPSVRGYNPKVEIPSDVLPYVYSVMIQSMPSANPAECPRSGAVWSCAGNLEAAGSIKIRYMKTHAQVPLGSYLIRVSMGNNGVTYDGTGTLTRGMVGVASPIAGDVSATPAS